MAIDKGEAGIAAHKKHEQKAQRREKRIRSEHPIIGGLILGLSSEPTSIRNWEKGASGERTVGKRLDQLEDEGVLYVLHDRQVPGTRGNIDHLAVTRSGIWIIDAKQWKGKLERRELGSWFTRDSRLYVGGRDRSKAVSGMKWQQDGVTAALADLNLDIPVISSLCFVGVDLGWFAEPFWLGNVFVCWPQKLFDQLKRPMPAPEWDLRQVTADLSRRLPANR